MSTLDDDVVRLLMELKEEIVKSNHVLEDIRDVLREDRKMMWRVLIMAIVGAFLLVGVKLMLPGG